jgi:hypothetical protein
VIVIRFSRPQSERRKVEAGFEVAEDGMEIVL